MQNTCAIISVKGIDNQSLDAVGATKSDKRIEPSVYFLPGGWIGVEKTRAVNSCRLDKLEHLTRVIINTCGQLELFFSGCFSLCDIYFKNNEEVSLLHVMGASVASSAALTSTRGLVI